MSLMLMVVLSGPGTYRLERFVSHPENYVQIPNFKDLYVLQGMKRENTTITSTKRKLSRKCIEWQI